MGADKLAENTPVAPKFIRPNCLFNPKIWDFNKKRASLCVRSPCSCALCSYLTYLDQAGIATVRLLFINRTSTSRSTATSSVP